MAVPEIDQEAKTSQVTKEADISIALNLRANTSKAQRRANVPQMPRKPGIDAPTLQYWPAGEARRITRLHSAQTRVWSPDLQS